MNNDTMWRRFTTLIRDDAAARCGLFVILISLGIFAIGLATHSVS